MVNETVLEFVIAPVDPLTNSTVGIETKFVPVILIVVAVAGAIVCDTSATVGDVGITLTWGDASRDMDLFLVTGDQSLTGTVLDFSWGTTTTEAVALSSSVPDGVYSLYIDQYQFTADVDYTMTFDYPDGQQQVMGGTSTDDGFVFTITKTTSGAVVTYLVNQI